MRDHVKLSTCMLIITGVFSFDNNEDLFVWSNTLIITPTLNGDEVHAEKMVGSTPCSRHTDTYPVSGL